MSKISAYIIAYNEAAKIRAAIESISWADEVLVVDSHSTDGTTEIAHSMGARVVQVSFIGFGDLRNQAVAACAHDWVFSLDADERCTDEVRGEVLSIIHSDNSSDVYYI
ncbi:MAG: glycosyltransferase family 2 protein, partial [Deltaproteobacteria bacterium]|nr:glycosyltransferase family 2 protein [Deltaproteobacteria bacterium]